MRRTALFMVVGFGLVTGCSESNSPTMAPEGPSYTGYIGGGGRAADSDSTGTSVTSDGTGYIGGGGRAADSTHTPPN